MIYYFLKHYTFSNHKAIFIYDSLFNERLLYFWFDIYELMLLEIGEERKRKIKLYSLIFLINNLIYRIFYLQCKYILYSYFYIISKVNVNIRLDQELKNNASLLAREMWTNLSTVLNMYLVKFTREKKLEIWINNETEFESFNNEEVKNIEWLSNFSSFMDSIKWK